MKLAAGAGKERDSESGLDYFGASFYDSVSFLEPIAATINHNRDTSAPSNVPLLRNHFFERSQLPPGTRSASLLLAAI